MHIQKLQLLNYKNYGELGLDFSERVNVLVGLNGSGKTNLLDAIYYLSFTKSAFAASDQHCMRKGESFFMVKGQFVKSSGTKEVMAAVQTGSRKVVREDNSEYQKLSDHIGRYPVIMIAPDDVDLVKEGSESRRRFFDTIISQLDQAYLENLIRYNHALKQRNSLLKMFQETGKPDWLAVESYDHLLMVHGSPIANRRISFAQEFLPIFRKYFTYLVDDKEVAGLDFTSDILKVGFAEGLYAHRQRDLALQRTSFGIHRDDYLFTLGSGDLKRLGSQGQQKSFVIALKLAQFEIVENYKEYKPILLLDDIFDKLDDRRIGRLLELIRRQFGQLFITDARPARTVDLLRSVKVPATVFHVEDGRIRLSEQSDAGEINRD